MTKARIHPETGKTLRRGVRPHVVYVGSLSRVLEVPGGYPSDGSDALHSGADLKASNEAFKAMRKEYTNISD